MKLTKSIAVFLTLSMLISLNACMAKTSEQNTSTAKQTSEEEILLLSLESQLLLEDWSSPEEISPDCFFQYYEALVSHGYVSKQEGESEIARQVVEDILMRYFEVDPQLIRMGSCYNKENQTYVVGGLENVLDYKIDQIEKVDGQTKIDYTLFYFEEFRQSGTLTVKMEDEYQYHFISHKIHEKGDVTHPSLQKS